MSQNTNEDIPIAGTDNSHKGFVLKLNSSGDIIWLKNDFVDNMRHVSLAHDNNGSYALASTLGLMMQAPTSATALL